MSEPTGHTVDGTPWEEPRGPHLPDRVVGVPPMAWLFIATAIVVTIADLPTLARMGSGPWFLGQGILGLVPPICSCLLGAVLFIRHPDAVQALPLLVLGAMLSAAVPVLRLGSTLVASILEGWSPSVDMSSPAIVGTSIYALFVSFVGFLSVLCLARGLQAVRRDGRGLDKALVRMLVVISVLIGATVAVGYLRLPIETVVNAFLLIGAVVTVIASLLASSYLVAVALAGRAGGERPAQGWGLVALSGVLSILLSAIIGSAGLVQTDAYQLIFTVIALVSVASAIALLAGFAMGTPMPAAPEPAPDAAATPDPPAATTPGSAGS